MGSWEETRIARTTGIDCRGGLTQILVNHKARRGRRDKGGRRSFLLGMLGSISVRLLSPRRYGGASREQTRGAEKSICGDNTIPRTDGFSIVAILVWLMRLSENRIWALVNVCRSTLFSGRMGFGHVFQNKICSRFMVGVRLLARGCSGKRCGPCGSRIDRARE
jgi:hypothetical protein